MSNVQGNLYLDSDGNFMCFSASPLSTLTAEVQLYVIGRSCYTLALPLTIRYISGETLYKS